MQRRNLKKFCDQMGNEVLIPHPPKSIISLVPSQTELLFDLGLDNEIAGITKFCVHPKHKVHQYNIIGGTKNFRFEAINEIKPDLIIGNKEENYQEGIEKLKECFPVWMSDIYTISDAFNMINQISEITGKVRKGNQIVQQISYSFEALNPIKKQKSCLYFIWKNPYMVAGGNTFIDVLLEKIGLINLAKHLNRYPEISIDQTPLSPDLILLSSEPYPFQQKHFNEFRTSFPNAEIHLVDGEMFSWYGSRLIKAAEYFNSLPFLK